MVLFALLLVSCGSDGILDGIPRGETGRVVRIIDGDAIILDTGLTVRLVGVEAPALQRRDQTSQPFAQEAKRLLEDMALGRLVRLYYPGLTRDRYDRALAYVFTADDLGPRIWLNEEIVRQGGARVRVYPDTAAKAEYLFEAEQLARVERAGLWSEKAYKIVPAKAVAGELSGFTIVQTQRLVRHDSIGDNFVCALRSGSSAFWIDVRPTAAEICHTPPMEALVRGYMRDGRLELTHSLNIEELAG
ncbi:MAG: thermonuclease family protein [Pseudomonadota bacterium]